MIGQNIKLLNMARLWRVILADGQLVPSENLTHQLFFPLHNGWMRGYQALTKSRAVVAELVDAQR